ncbi:hypothetical protein ACOMHN_027499 [Nucella lapillus]
MAARTPGGKRRSVFKRYTALEALDEVLNDNDSDDEDFLGSSEDDTDEEESDINQHHPLLSGLLLLSDDPIFEASDLDRDETEMETSGESDTADEPVASTSHASPPRNRGRGRDRGRVRGRDRGRGHSRGSRRGPRLPRTQTRGHGRGMGRGIQQPELVREWEPADPNPPNPNVIFTGNPGLKKNTDSFKPVDYLELFFDDDLMNSIIINTNLYAQQFLEANPNLPPHARAKDWTPVDAGEMKRFLGLVLLMGIVKLPTIALYWSRRVLYRFGVFSSVMTKNRFQLILQFLHFHDNATMPGPNDPNYDRLYKIRPVVDHLHEKFQEVYEPRQAVCVDESLLLWKGRLIFRQYIPMKRARFGIKIYLCCESDGDVKGGGGYCYRFKVYAGKQDPVNEVDPVLRAVDGGNNNLSISEKMVVFLIATLLDKGYHVYTDNWYTSLKLFLFLLSRNTLACGTVQQNRGIPQELRDVQLNPGDSAAVCGDGRIVATKYHSTKVVHLLSSAHGHTEGAIPDRRRRGITKRPGASYNCNMGGVNKQDQLIHPYDCTRKSLKWTKKLFFHFLQVAACNAFILAKSGDNQPTKFLDFLESVVCSWLWPDCVPSVEEDRSDDEVRLSVGHFCFPIPPTPSKATPQKPCRVCRKKLSVRHDTRHYCPFCPSKPGLCFPQCFMDYHTKFVFW